MIKALHKFTGEQIELPTDSPKEIVDAWLVASEYEKLAKSLKDQLKVYLPVLIGDSGASEPVGSYMFRHSVVQRMNYRKSVLREIFDEDTLDLFLKPAKTEIDKYIADNLESLGEASSSLRNALEPEGKPYEIFRLEKIK